MCYSISCQAICDAPGMFIDVEIKCPGSVHGARTFAYCQFSFCISENLFSRKIQAFLQGVIRWTRICTAATLGDHAFPLLPYVMKEYDHCNSSEQVMFNTMLRSARSQIKLHSNV